MAEGCVFLFIAEVLKIGDCILIVRIVEVIRGKFGVFSLLIISHLVTLIGIDLHGQPGLVVFKKFIDVILVVLRSWSVESVGLETIYSVDDLGLAINFEID